MHIAGKDKTERVRVHFENTKAGTGVDRFRRAGFKLARIFPMQRVALDGKILDEYLTAVS